MNSNDDLSPDISLSVLSEHIIISRTAFLLFENSFILVNSGYRFKYFCSFVRRIDLNFFLNLIIFLMYPCISLNIFTVDGFSGARMKMDLTSRILNPVKTEYVIISVSQNQWVS